MLFRSEASNTRTWQPPADFALRLPFTLPLGQGRNLTISSVAQLYNQETNKWLVNEGFAAAEVVKAALVLGPSPGDKHSYASHPFPSQFAPVCGKPRKEKRGGLKDWQVKKQFYQVKTTGGAKPRSPGLPSRVAASCAVSATGQPAASRRSSSNSRRSSSSRLRGPAAQRPASLASRCCALAHVRPPPAFPASGMQRKSPRSFLMPYRLVIPFRCVQSG